MYNKNYLPKMSLRNHSSREVLKVLTKHYGFSIERISSSHYQLKHIDGRRVTVVRADPIKIGTLKSIISQAKTTEDEFLKYI
jgi:predicted RNA binding protein YcfA (HicA-like mRNA interferase family)